MLANLMSSFDSEKDALLAQIRDGDGTVSTTINLPAYNRFSLFTYDYIT